VVAEIAVLIGHASLMWLYGQVKQPATQLAMGLGLGSCEIELAGKVFLFGHRGAITLLCCFVVSAPVPVNLEILTMNLKGLADRMWYAALGDVLFWEVLEGAGDVLGLVLGSERGGRGALREGAKKRNKERKILFTQALALSWLRLLRLCHYIGWLCHL